MSFIIDRPTRYALCAMSRLIHDPERKPLPAGRIARDSRLPVAATRKALRRLADADLVRAVPGKGYSLGRRAEECSVLDVVRAMARDDELSRMGCMMKEEACPMETMCLFYGACNEIRRTVRTWLGGVPIRSLRVDDKGRPVCFLEGVQKPFADIDLFNVSRARPARASSRYARGRRPVR